MANDSIQIVRGADTPLFVTKTNGDDTVKDLTGWTLISWVEYRCKVLVELEVKVVDLTTGDHKIIANEASINKIHPSNGCDLVLKYISPLGLASIVKVNLEIR